ncbi:D-alanyl-D-alanine carboxypeptidase [Cohnella sp. CBP 2801]|uniref:D-alanyl-D-alanine carboxypeptidase n=2 Tax=Cohnella zeiphila TaxID=2761120 RepID=A0A7X0VUJ8_9BACL|nr:D-alanyl-D-alanine carboxypeptidase [Cohnella zeiphila]
MEDAAIAAPATAEPVIAAPGTEDKAITAPATENTTDDSKTEDPAIEGTAIEAKSAALLDAKSGKWLYLQNADEALAPASMSKMMTELVVLEQIRSGKLNWDDEAVASRYAANVVGSAMGLRSGQSVSVRELFAAMAIHSANDAAVALAEKVAGSETAFVKLMNDEAKAIGLSDRTRFANATGLSKEDLTAFSTADSATDTKMTAKDAALLASRLVGGFPELLKFTKKSETPAADGKTMLATSNEMLPGQQFGMKGNDGLKTGYTSAAGYCFTGSFLIGGHRYISVIMGATTPEARFEMTSKLLEVGRIA